MVKLAREVAKAMGGELLAVYTVAEGTAAFLVTTDCGLLEVRVPMDAKTLDDCPDEAQHYCSGLQVAQALAAEGVGFSSDDSRKKLMNTLSSHDRVLSSTLAKGWIEYHMDEIKQRKST